MIFPATKSSVINARNAQIINDYLYGNLTIRDIAHKNALSFMMVHTILKENQSLLDEEARFNRLQRIHEIKRQLERPEVQKVIVSPDKWVDLWRKEFESEEREKLIDNKVQVIVSLEAKDAVENSQSNLILNNTIKSNQDILNDNQETSTQEK